MNCESNGRPVGVFDSGVGGLTVVAELARRLPCESFYYIGDTARVPYGNKSPETICAYARQITSHLQTHGVKAVVVACNTATAFALASLEREFPFPVLGVVQPGVEAALTATRNGRIGIIGTAGTIGSGAYQNALLKNNPELVLVSQATPLLVPLVEENWINHQATQMILQEYLKPLIQAQVDTIVLGCTHYPLLKNQIQKVVGQDVVLVDSAENMAIALERRLQSENLLSESKTADVRIAATDVSPHFQPLAKRFLARDVTEIERVRFS